MTARHGDICEFEKKRRQNEMEWMGHVFDRFGGEVSGALWTDFSPDRLAKPIETGENSGK